MNKLLVVVDMQNDFIDGVLGTKEAQAIVKPTAEFVKKFNGYVFTTIDGHDETYLESVEGKHLPIKHCIKETVGWEVNKDIATAFSTRAGRTFEKSSFGCLAFSDPEWYCGDMYDEVILCGVCTDICVIANAIIFKTALPNTEVTVLEDLCAGTTPEMHQKAMDVMKSLHINIKKSTDYQE